MTSDVHARPSTTRSLPHASAIPLILSLLLLLLLSGCASEPASGSGETLIPNLSDAPPPGIRLLLDSERTQIMADSILRAASEAGVAVATLDARAAADDSQTATAETETFQGVGPAEVATSAAEDEAAEDEAAEAAVAESAEESAEGEEAESLADDAEESQTDAESALDDVEALLNMPPTVTVRNRSVNIRAEPALNGTVVAGANQGAIFEALGRSEDGNWWRICCVRGPQDPVGEATQRAWISSVVVEANPSALIQPIIGPLFPDDLTVTWNVAYACGSERCEVDRCTATIQAEVADASDSRWLEIQRDLVWADACGDDSTWIHQVDRLEGMDRYGNASDLFLFDFWAGRDPGPLNSLFSLSADKQVKTFCSQEQQAELEEGGGWTALYNGITCHDVGTGMLVSMKYTKRWLFTGEFEGERYERAYFGDYEVYEVRLANTNAELALVNP